MNRFLACWAMVLLTVVEFAPGAGAYGGGVCRITGRIVFSPRSAGEGGWSIEDGVIDCAGVLSGGNKRILGPGQFQGSGSYSSALPAAGGACPAQAGSGTVEYRIPTSGGYLVVNEPDSYTLVGVGSFATPTLHGTFEVAPPYDGDCVSKPMTGATFVAQASLYRGVQPTKT